MNIVVHDYGVIRDAFVNDSVKRDSLLGYSQKFTKCITVDEYTVYVAKLSRNLPFHPADERNLMGDF